MLLITDLQGGRPGVPPIPLIPSATLYPAHFPVWALSPLGVLGAAMGITLRGQFMLLFWDAWGSLELRPRNDDLKSDKL